MMPEKNQKIIEIGNKHGLMMHDPIQRYHTANAMQEYADQQIADKEKERLYWQQRCLAAEKFIKESPCDPDIYPEQIKAYKNWQQLKNQSTKEEI